MKKFFKKKPADPDIPDTVEESQKGGRGYPQEYLVASLRERRLLVAIRGVTIALIAAMLLNIVQGFLLVTLMPLKEIRPFLVQVAEKGTLVASIKPIQDTFDAKDVLTEKLVREYVVNRHEILRSDEVMRERWSPSGYLGTTTDPAEYARFRASTTSVLDNIRSQDAKRLATIQSVSTISAGKVYVVDFRSTSYDQSDKVVDQRVYTATVEIEFRPLKNLTRDQMMIDPTGFTVVNYSLAEKDQ